MLRELVDLDWEDTTEVIPACVTRAADALFTYSDRQRRFVRLHLPMRRSSCSPGRAKQVHPVGVDHRRRASCSSSSTKPRATDDTSAGEDRRRRNSRRQFSGSFSAVLGGRHYGQDSEGIARRGD